jgi:tetratricopeptide (TPR) repeat protein
MTAAPDFSQAVEAFQRGELDSALAAAEAAVGSAPSPQWQHLLGLIHCRMGDPASGAEHLRAAAEAEPGNIPFQVMLMRALVDAGRAAEVLEMPEPPPIRSAAELELWRARGEAAEAAANPEACARAWSKVGAATPRDWRAIGNLAKALGELGRWREAADSFLKATELNPDEAMVRRDAASALVQVGREHQSKLQFDEAEAAFRRAYQLEPTDRGVILQLGASLERTNQLDSLRSLLEEAGAAGIDENGLAYLHALLARRERRLEEARDLLLRADPDEEPVQWNALRAKIEDALGNEAEAFEAATEMKRAALERAIGDGDRDIWDRNAKAYRQELRELASAVNPEWAARVPLLTEPWDQRIAFLLGFPRSGTTLLDTFLMGHPEVAVLEEEQLVGRASQGLKVEDLPVQPLSWVRNARKAYLEALARRVGADFRGMTIDKFPLDMGVAPIIQAMFPGAPIVFAQRHPCDVVLSGFMQPFGMVNFPNIHTAADYYDSMMGIWTASRQAMDLNVHTVVYEELVADPEASLRPLVAFLGLEWDGRVLEHQRTASERGTIVTPSYDQVSAPVSTGASGRWKRYLKQLEPVLPILLPWAERLGYRD